MPTADVINPDSPLFFPVALRPLDTILKSHKSIGMQAVCRIADNDSEEDEVIAIHKMNYKLVPNIEVYSNFERALRASGLDMSHVVVTDSLAYQGGRALRTYRFPEHQYDIGAKDPVQLQLRVSNSYDGSSRFSVMFGAFRVVCSNGLIIGDPIVNSQQKHTASLDVGRIAAQLRSAVSIMDRNVDTWRRWKQQPCPTTIAEAVVEGMDISELSKKRILNRFRANQPTDGNSVWALFNAMTYWSSHTDVKPSSADNFSAIMLEREQKIRRVLDSPLFQIAA